MAGHAAPLSLPLPPVCAARNAASLAVSDSIVSAESLALALADDSDDGLLTLAVAAGVILAHPPDGIGGSPAFATPGSNPTCY